MGRVPSDGKIPDDMSAEGKCTVGHGELLINCQSGITESDGSQRRNARQSDHGETQMGWSLRGFTSQMSGEPKSDILLTR